MGAIYAIVAIGFVVVYNVTNIINFAQGDYTMLGAVVAAVLVHKALPTSIAVPVAVACVLVIGGATYRLAVRPARRASMISLIIITIGVSAVLRGGALAAWGKNPLTMPNFVAGAPWRVGGVVLVPQALFILATTLLVVAALQIFVDRTFAGKAFRACALNPRAAELVGISVERMAWVAFAVSGALGALGGALIAPITLATYDMGLLLGIKGFIAAIAGGLTNPLAAVAGGLALGLLEAIGTTYINSAYGSAFALAVLLVMLVIRPRGLFSRANEEPLG